MDRQTNTRGVITWPPAGRLHYNLSMYLLRYCNYYDGHFLPVITP